MGAFRLLGEREIHRGHVISVGSARYVAPDGEEFERDVVHHPGAVAVLPLHDDGTVTLVRQFRAPLGHDVLEIPAGLRDVADEEPIATAARELAEEVGLRAERIEHLVAFHSSAGCSDEVVEVFVASGLHATDPGLVGIEERHLVVERIAFGDALVMVSDGRITDAKTIIGLSLAARQR